MPNPLTAMAHLLAGLHDENNHITLDGFYDDVAPLTDLERDLIARLPFDEAEWLETAASRALFGEAGYSTLERLWARPTCEIHGVWGGYMGPGHKTIVPTDAHAKVSFRLVANQRPARRPGRHARRTSRPTSLPGSPPTSSSSATACGPIWCRSTPLPCRHWCARSAGPSTTRCCSWAKADPVPRPTSPRFSKPRWYSSGAGLPTDRIHAPDEHAVISVLLKGAEAAAYLWDELAALPSR